MMERVRSSILLRVGQVRRLSEERERERVAERVYQSNTTGVSARGTPFTLWDGRVGKYEWERTSERLMGSRMEREDGKVCERYIKSENKGNIRGKMTCNIRGSWRYFRRGHPRVGRSVEE